MRSAELIVLPARHSHGKRPFGKLAALAALEAYPCPSRKSKVSGLNNSQAVLFRHGSWDGCNNLRTEMPVHAKPNRLVGFEAASRWLQKGQRQAELT